MAGKVFVSILIKEKKVSNTAKEVSSNKKKSILKFSKNKINAQLCLSYMTQHVHLALTKQTKT